MVRIRGLRGRWEAVSFNLHASVELKHEQHRAAYSIFFDGSFMAIDNHRKWKWIPQVQVQTYAWSNF